MADLLFRAFFRPSAGGIKIMKRRFSVDLGQKGRADVSKSVVHPLVFLAVLCCGQAISPSAFGEETAGPRPTEVSVALKPTAYSVDPGPEQLVGEQLHKGGARFLWYDVLWNPTEDFSEPSGKKAGGGKPVAYRIYFDYRDLENFHFLDYSPADSSVSLGLCEAGVERRLAGGKVNGGALRLARHGAHLALFQAGRLLFHAFDERLQGGAVGFREIGRRKRNGGRSRRQPKVVPTEEVHFADDFMRSAKEERDNSEWHKFNCEKGNGGFFIGELRNPLLSANAFNYLAAGREVIAAVGVPTWDHYRFSVSLRGPAAGEIGTVFAFRDARNYGLFRWTARKTAADGAVTGEGERELILVRDGKREVLETAPGGYLPGQWYRVEARVDYERLRLFIDGHLVFSRHDPYLCAGGAGLWANVAKPKKPVAGPEAQPIARNSLYDLMQGHAVFDDVEVETLFAFADDFRTPGELSGGWLAGPGSWVVDVPRRGAAETGEAADTAGVLRAPPGGGKALTGTRRLGSCRLSCKLRLGRDANTGEPTGSAGLVFLYRDELNYYAALVTPKELRLSRVTEGKTETADQVALPDETPRPKTASAVPFRGHRLSVTVDHGHIRAVWAGRYSVETFDPEPRLRGRAGLLALPPGGSISPRPAGKTAAEPEAARRNVVASARFARFRIERLVAPSPLISANAVFGAESTMRGWTQTDNEWIPAQRLVEVDGRPVDARWHGGQFPGDVELSMEPRRVLQPDYEAGLSVSKDGRGRNNGYIFRYRSPAAAAVAAKTERAKKKMSSPPSSSPTVAAGTKNSAGKKEAKEETARPEVIFIRQGRQVMRKKTPFPVDKLHSLAVRRCGKYIVGLVNGRPAAVFRDDHPLTGSKVAYFTRGLRAKAEAFKILSPGFFNDDFSRAPTDWRTAGNVIAEVTNRWQCDPRWTFMSWKNDRTKKEGTQAAVLWSKKKWPGDVTVEFYIGNKMERDRGALYTYARDINVTLSSDGNDLTKGYTFMFGGRKNAKSYILRNDKILAERPVRIPTNPGIVHRHWFFVRVERRSLPNGKVRLSFSVDRFFAKEPAGEWVVTDDKPLQGNRLALWVYDHAVMIARVRISGTVAGTEDPAWKPGPLRTYYDLPEWKKYR